jgi:hypothetical protein
MRLDKNPNGYAGRVLPWGVGGFAPQKLKPPGLTVRDATHNDHVPTTLSFFPPRRRYRLEYHRYAQYR